MKVTLFSTMSESADQETTEFTAVRNMWLQMPATLPVSDNKKIKQLQEMLLGMSKELLVVKTQSWRNIARDAKTKGFKIAASAVISAAGDRMAYQMEINMDTEEELP